MAIYHLQLQSISRAAGRSAVGAAAYRAGERLRDERTGVLHNHSGRRDVSHKEIVLPPQLDAAALAWAADRASLWNAAERAETRRNSRVAREYQVALPAELNAAQRLELARDFALELAGRHQVAIDLAVHEPRPGGDARNYHAHLLATTRAVSAAGFGAKTGLELSGATRQQRGLAPGLAEFNAIRERWAALANEALQAAGVDARIDHRSYQAQGIDREPQPHIPYAAVLAERRGLRSQIAERLRERYRERVRQRELRREGAQQPAAVPTGVDYSAGESLEQIRRQARETWLRMRREALQPSESQPTAERERTDGDLVL